MSEVLLVLGASARAAAFSALRARFPPVAGDLFADVDLRACCRAERVQDYPDGLEQVAGNAPQGPWLYTGALENYPALVERISCQRTLSGNAGSVLRQVRDPLKVAEALARDGLPHLKVCDGTPSVGGPAAWLRKPRRSGGGLGIEKIRLDGNGDFNEEVADDADWYYQQWIEGTSCSAVYVAAGGRAVLLGVTQQIIGMPWTGAGPFQYAGSLGPLRPDTLQLDTFRAIGECLARQFKLTGLFGVDAVLSSGQVWPVEVNPRYTASVEILERGLAMDAITLHMAACSEGRLPVGMAHNRRESSHTTFFGKAILYAPEPFTVEPDFVQFAQSANQGQSWPLVADIPAMGTSIAARQPVTTVFAEAGSLPLLNERLQNRLRQVRRLLAI